jgi:hypothetical protein
MPATPFSRFAFAVASSAQNRALLALLASDILFFLILFHHSIPGALLVVVLLVLMAADIVAFSALGAVAAIRRGRAPMAIAAYAALAVLAVSTLALLYRFPDTFRFVPPVLWTAPGIAGSASGDVGIASLAASAGLVFLGAMFLFGRRIG